MAPDLLQATDLWKSYDGLSYVLRGVELHLEQGAGVLIWGRNGSGKTTLLNLLGCLDVPDRGQILLEGKEVTQARPRERALFRLHRIGFIFQDHNLLEELTIRQNVLLPLRLSRDTGAGERADELLQAFGLQPLAERRPMQVSMGERQKAAIARALANRPALILADEPSASLDEDSALELLDLLRDLQRDGTAVVLASHDPLARQLGWPMLELHRGKLTPR